MLIRINSQAAAMNDKIREKVRLGMEESGSTARSVDIIKGTQKGLWGLFEDTLAISWMCPPGDDEARKNIARDVEAAERSVGPLLRKYCVISDSDVACFVHEGVIATGEQARDSWRALFAATVLRWDEANGHGGNTIPDDKTRHARFPLPSPLDETTSHSTRLPKTAAKSLVIPQAGRAK
jgi:hypothetical protein